MDQKPNKQHVQLPRKNEQLTGNEALTYVTIKRFDNAQHRCYPSLKKIVEKSGLSEPTVLKCIKALEDKGYIEVDRSDRYNKYKFLNVEDFNFDMFSFDFLDNDDLTPKQKGAWILCQQHTMIDEDTATTSYTTAKLAQVTGMNRKTVKEFESSFQEQGLMTTDGQTKVFYPRNFGQAIILKLKDHEDKINKNTDDIAELKRQIEILNNALKARQQ